MNPGEQDEMNYQPVAQAPAGQTPSAAAPQPPQEAVSNAQSEVKRPEAIEAEAVSWQASEFVENQKSGVWIVLFLLASLVVCGLAYLIIQSILSVVVVGVALTAFAVVAFQKPRTLTYSLFGSTLRIGEKSFKYDDFRSFSLVRDGALWSIVLHPLKRFMPPLTIYFAQEDGEKIFDTLASHLPQEEHQLDSVDRLMRKIRF